MDFFMTLAIILLDVLLTERGLVSSILPVPFFGRRWKIALLKPGGGEDPFHQLPDNPQKNWCSNSD